MYIYIPNVYYSEKVHLSSILLWWMVFTKVLQEVVNSVRISTTNARENIRVKA